MLKTTSKEQEERVMSLLTKDKLSVIDQDDDGVYIDDFITYDEMAAVVDYLRSVTPMKDLFETCWLAYRRKGSKKKSLEYWRKLADKDKERVLAHIKAYVATREVKFQKDFERYLRDKIFDTIVFSGNSVAYDPSKLEKGKDGNDVYMPVCEGALSYNDYYKCYMYVGFWDGHISDGYTDANRPDGATVVLNNGRGTVRWSRERKVWDLEKL